ncbi:MAG: hypothetical protein ACM3ZT_03475 [Bacillota bacterium]
MRAHRFSHSIAALAALGLAVAACSSTPSKPAPAYGCALNGAGYPPCAPVPVGAYYPYGYPYGYLYPGVILVPVVVPPPATTVPPVKPKPPKPAPPVKHPRRDLPKPKPCRTINGMRVCPPP